MAILAFVGFGGNGVSIFSGKSNYDYWATIFKTGNTSEGTPVLAGPINFQEMK